MQAAEDPVVDPAGSAPSGAVSDSVTDSPRLHSATVRRGAEGPQVGKQASLLATRCDANAVPVLQVLRNTSAKTSTSALDIQDSSVEQQQQQQKKHDPSPAKPAASSTLGLDGCGPYNGGGGGGGAPLPVEARRRGGADRVKVRLRVAGKKPPGKRDSVADGDGLMVSPKEKSISVSNDFDAGRRSGGGDYDGSLGGGGGGVGNNSDHAPASIPWQKNKGSPSADRSDSDFKVPQCKPPSVEERISAIKEDQERRLEKMRQKLMAERADTVAPRPKTLTRVRQGGYKAIAERRSRTAGGSGVPLAIDMRASDLTQTESFGSDKGSSFPSGVSSPSCASLPTPGVMQQRQQQEMDGEDSDGDSLLAIEKDDA
ncbi:hypothetical protein DQ04_00531110 [Trypanosoma grayi]|uniref:hypothetical protein n=1 Tax=Trypanosoma grayi TaxID=71804 RepID=UPI0004F485E2|nr:hypothetical protein DQ04_00531110 [Trypanosoma grayi]KEG14306.1 hypothetical protein DQ04_00531110 [Trypanosoma grayi]